MAEETATTTTTTMKEFGGVEVSLTRGNWQFVPAELLSQGKVNLLKSPCGTGKTTAIKSFMEQHASTETRIVVVTFRQTLAAKLASTLECSNYLGISSSKRINLEEHRRLVISVESLMRMGSSSDALSFTVPLPDILILDEYCSLIEHAFNNVTLDYARRALFFDYMFASIVSEKTTTIIADAYLTERSIGTLVSAIRRYQHATLQTPERIQILENLYRGRQRKILYTHCFPQWKRIHDELVKDEKERLYVFSNCKTVLDGIQNEKMVKGSVGGKDNKETQCYPREVTKGDLYMSSDSSHEIKSSGSQSPDRVWVKYKHTYATPTLCAGVDFSKSYFTTTVGYAGNASTSPLGTLQQLARVRNPITGNIILYVFKSSAKPKVYSTEDVKEAILSHNKSIKKNLLSCAQIGYKINASKRALRAEMNHDPVNELLVEVVRDQLHSAQDFLGQLKLLAQGDDFVFQEIPKSGSNGMGLSPSAKKAATNRKKKSKGSTTMILDEEAEEEENNEEVETAQEDSKTKKKKKDKSDTIGSVMNQGKEYQSKLLGAWNGIFDYDSILVSPCLLELKDFLRTWNVLGAYGDFSQMVLCDTYSSSNEEEKLKRNLVFDPERSSLFYSLYVRDGKQETFHKFITGHALDTLTDNVNEGRMGAAAYDSKLFGLFVDLLDLFGVSPKGQLYTTLEFFGAKKHLPIEGATVWDGVLPGIDDQVEHREDLRLALDSLFRIFDDGQLNTPTTFEVLKKTLADHWTALCLSSFLTNRDRKVLGTSLTQPSLTNNDKTQIMWFAVRLLKKLVGYIGLSVIETSSYTQALFSDPAKRIRCRKYALIGFRERAMLSLLRVLKERRIMPHDTILFPEADPFKLLKNNPYSNITTIDRFVNPSFYSQKWAEEFPAHWNKLHMKSPDSEERFVFNNEENKEIVGSLVGNSVLLDHAPCRIQNIIPYMMLWGVHNNGEVDFSRLGLCTALFTCPSSWKEEKEKEEEEEKEKTTPTPPSTPPSPIVVSPDCIDTTDTDAQALVDLFSSSDAMRMLEECCFDDDNDADILCQEQCEGV